MDLAYEKSDWVATEAATALMRNNGPLLAYIGGKAAAVTSKDHNFVPGEMVEKQLIVINNSRQTVKAECNWSIAVPNLIAGNKEIEIPTGEQQRIPIRFELPQTLKPGSYQLQAAVKFSDGQLQEDQFSIDVLPSPRRPDVRGKIAVLDPRGRARELLRSTGIPFDEVAGNSDLTGYDLLIVDKGAERRRASAEHSRVRRAESDHFGQTGEVLESLRLSYGRIWIEECFGRIPSHSLWPGSRPGI
jgi:hypothetical protein